MTQLEKHFDIQNILVIFQDLEFLGLGFEFGISFAFLN